MRWNRLKNGKMLQAAADAGFDVVVTTDQNIRYQQNLHKLPISVMAICIRDTRLDALIEVMPLIALALDGHLPRTFVEITGDDE